MAGDASPDRVRELFNQALGLRPEARGGFLADACAQEPATMREVESLLRAAGEATGFLARPAPPVEVVPTAVGPYEILDPLGRGGMGVVYRAHHRQTGLPVALKMVRLPSQGLLGSIRREIRALARIRHPGIVRIVDEGLDSGMPWYAMELLEGVTLRQFAAAREPSAPGEEPWWTRTLAQGRDPRIAAIAVLEQDLGGTGAEGAVPPTLRPALPPETLTSILTLVRRLCSPLAYLHGEGMVHRDLKPDNVLVRPDGRPVIVDFGLLVQFSGGDLSRDALEVGGDIAGTVTYMAPEQGRGEVVDARADLYALGCMLYELLAGRAPFVADSAATLLRLHQQAEPQRPSELAAGIPAGLEDLVLLLLAKDPRQRLGHADDVAAALARLGAQDVGAEGGPPPRAYLYRPAMAGRDDALGTCVGVIRALCDGKGGLLLVGGESGVGKTRLAGEAASVAREAGVEVITGECLPRGASDAGALHPMRRLLQRIGDRCRERGWNETERLLGRRGKVFAQYEPSLAALPGQDAYPDVVDLPAEAARIRIWSYLSETLTELSRERPVLLVLDDLQWADDLTLGALELLLRGGHFERMRVSILGTYRSEEVSEDLGKLIKAQAAQKLALGRLAEGSVGEIVSDMLALKLAPSVFVGFLAKHSEGNPFFVAEYLRTAAAEGVLWRDALGAWQVGEAGGEAATAATYEGLPLPRSLRDLVLRRLDGLPPEARRLADASAVLGRKPDTVVVSDVLAIDETLFNEALAILTTRQVLEQASPGHLRFLHDKIREVTYEQVAVEQRIELHRGSAEAMELRYAATREEHLAALGYHWAHGGVEDKARRCYLAVARLSVKRHGHDEAERHYRSYLGLVHEPAAESIAARNELGHDVLQRRGRMQEAEAEHREAVDAARRLGDRDCEAASLRSLGSVHWRMGRMEEARRHYVRALAIDREVGARRSEGSDLGNLAILHHNQGRMEEARRLYEQVLAIHREIGDRRSEGIDLGNLANLHHEQGRMEEARGLCEQALAIHREVGDRRFEGIVLGNLAGLHLEQGRMEEARGLHEQALAIHREVGDQRFEGIALANLTSLLALAEGGGASARRLAVGASEVLKSVGDRLELGKLACTRGHFALSTGDSAAGHLCDARTSATEVSAGPESELGKSIAKLERAQAALELGGPLVRGYCPEDLTSGQLRWLREHRPEAIPPEVMARLNDDGTLRDQSA